VPLAGSTSEEGSSWDLAGSQPAVSSIFRSREQRQTEEAALVAALAEQFDRARQRGEWPRLKCLELLFVRGWANKEVAAALDMSEQAVANAKFDFLARLRARVGTREGIEPS